MKNKSIFYVLILLCAIAGIWTQAGCTAKRKVIAQPLKEQGPEYLFEQLKKNELKFSTLSAKFNVDAELNNENTTFSGAFYLKRDSLIWLSISKFGLEAARFLITPDSAKMINRLNNTYFLGDFNYVCELFNVDFDFDILQSLMVGNDFSYYDNDVFKASIDNKDYKLSTIGRRKLKKFVKAGQEDQRVLIQDIWLDPETFKIVKISMKEVKQENRKFDAFYSGFDLVENQRFPMEMRYEINDVKRYLVKISYSKITIDQPGSMSFKIPANYTPAQPLKPKQ